MLVHLNSEDTSRWHVTESHCSQASSRVALTLEPPSDFHLRVVTLTGDAAELGASLQFAKKKRQPIRDYRLFCQDLKVNQASYAVVAFPKKFQA
jgi:hypothetical protein